MKPGFYSLDSTRERSVRVRWGLRDRMPARYNTIIVVRKRNARGDEVEYHTVGRNGPRIWRTGEPNPPGTPGYQAAYDAAVGPHSCWRRGIPGMAGLR